MASSLTVDVLIIGGGPAGSSAAITCAAGGLSVALLEARPFPRTAPGETLHPGVQPLLERLGAAAALEEAGFLRHAGIWVDRAGEPEFQPYGSDERGPWLGYQAVRSEFDALLLERARSSGVRVLQPHSALRVVRRGNRVAGAVTSAGTVRAAITVDASGRSAWLARQLFLPFRRASRKLIAVYGYSEGECPARESAPHFRYLTDGWIWTARVRSNLFHWTRLYTTPVSPRGFGPPSEFAGLQPVGRPRGSDVTWRVLEPCAGPGYFVAGDAASIADPSTSHGVLRALLCGMLAGRLVLRSAFLHTPEPALAAEYRAWVRSSFESDWARASALTPVDLSLNRIGEPQ